LGILRRIKDRRQPWKTGSEPSRSTLLEILEPRILLSADSLLNVIIPDQGQDTFLHNMQEVVQHAELLETHEEVGEQIPVIDQVTDQEPDPSDILETNLYEPIVTFFTNRDNTDVDEPVGVLSNFSEDFSETSGYLNININNIGAAQVNGDIAVLSNDFDGDIENKVGTTEDGSMPICINDADLSTEYTTSIEIRGPPASGISGSSANIPEGLMETITTTGSDAPVYLPGIQVWTSASSTVFPNIVESGSLINMDTFRADLRFADIDGAGFATVILDTGIDVDHPFFGPDLDSDGIADRIVYQWDYAYNDSDASDVHGHGSNVSSIVASSDSTYTGMAPGVDIIHLKVLNDTASGFFSWAESALQWVVSNVSTYNIVSVNMSLGDGKNWSTAGSHYGLGDELAALAALDVVVRQCVL